MGFWERVTGKMTNEPTPPAMAPPRAAQRNPEPVPETAPEVAPAVPAQAPDMQYVEHQVVLGELLGDIAARHKVSPDSVIAANGLAHPDRIYPGMQLRVPTS